MAESEGRVVYYQGREYMRFPHGNTFKFILMGEYKASQPASSSSTSQTPSNCVSTRQSSAQPSEDDDDVVITGSQPVTSSSNLFRPRNSRKPFHGESTPSIKATPSGSTKRKHDETEDHAVYASAHQQPKRMKQMLRVPRQAKAPSSQRQRYPAHVYPYQKNYSSPQMQYAQYVHQPQPPSSSAYASEQQHQSTVRLPQHIQARHNKQPFMHADDAQALRNPRPALPSPRMPAIPQEWPPQEPHPLLEAWNAVEGYGPQHQQDVPLTYPAQGTYHIEQTYGFQGLADLDQQDPSRLARQAGHRESTTVHDAHQHDIEQHQGSALAFKPSDDSEQQSTTNPQATLRDSTTTPSVLASDVLIPPTKVDHLPRISPSTAPDQIGQSKQSSAGSKNELPPSTKPHSVMNLEEQSSAAQVQVMPSKAGGKRKFSLDEDGLEITEAPSKRRKSDIKARTPHSEQHVQTQQASEPSNHDFTVYATEQDSTEHSSAEDPTSPEYALKHFDPLQLANVGDKELVDWFTAGQLRCKYSPIQLRQLFSDDYLASLKMWDIMDPLFSEGQTTHSSGAADDSNLTQSPLTPPDSELEEIDRFLREPNPEGGNTADLGGELEESLHLEGAPSSTLGQNTGGGVDSRQNISTTGDVQPTSLEETIVTNPHEENGSGKGVNKAKASEEVGGDLVEQQSVDLDNGPPETVGDGVANKNLQLLPDHEQDWLRVFDWSNPAQDTSFALKFDP